MTIEVTPKITVCYRHSQTETSLRCNRCNKYICAKCAQRSPVGFRCPDCLVELEDRFYSNVKDETLNPFDRALAQPFFTYLLIAINLVVFAAMELQGGSTNDDVLIKFGANYGPLMLWDNQWWRLFTYMFLHIGVQHLVFNTIGLMAFGLESERLYGQAKFITIYLLTGLFGGLLSFAVRGPMTFSAGASGAIFGIIGMQLAFFAYYYYRLGDFSSQKVKSMFTLIGVSLVLGVSGIMPADNWAHMGGLVSGVILGYLLAPRYAVDQTKSPRRIYDRASFVRRWWVSLLAILLFMAGTWNMSNYWQNNFNNTKDLINDLRDLIENPPPSQP